MFEISSESFNEDIRDEKLRFQLTARKKGNVLYDCCLLVAYMQTLLYAGFFFFFILKNMSIKQEILVENPVFSFPQFSYSKN